MMDFSTIGGLSKEEMSLIAKRAEAWLDVNCSKIETEIEKDSYNLYSCIATADTIRMSLDDKLDEVNVDFMKDMVWLLIFQLIVLQEAVNKRQEEKRKETENNEP